MRDLLLVSSSVVHGYGYLEQCEADVRALFSNRKKILFFPFALKDHDAYAAKVRNRFAELGFELTSIHQAADPATAIKEAQGFFVGGGNTFRLLASMQNAGLLPKLRSRVRAGVPYMGSSAGSNLACPTIMTTNDMPIVFPRNFKALELIPFQLNAHYLDPDPTSKHQGETRETRLREYHEMNDLPVLSPPQGAHLRVQGDRAQLRGIHGARLFRRGREPVEFAPGSELNFLLADANAE